MTSHGPRPRSGTAGCRTCSRLACSTASSAAVALLLAGCGGGGPPKLTQADAAPLIALAGKIAAEGGCGQAHDIAQLQRRTIALVNSRRVPPALQEPLVSGVNDLASRAPLCLPAVTPATPTPRPKPKPHPPHHGHGKKHGHGDGGDEH